MLSSHSTLSGDPICDNAWGGIEDCRKGEWRRGFATLRTIAASEHATADLPSLYYAYLGFGLAAFDNKYETGLEICQVGIQRGSCEPESYVNLARIYLLGNRRALASAALDSGLEIDPENDGIRRLRAAMGQRRGLVLPFLPRSHALNRILGQLRRSVRGERHRS